MGSDKPPHTLKSCFASKSEEPYLPHSLNISCLGLIFQSQFSFSFDKFYDTFFPKLNFSRNLGSNLIKKFTILGAKSHRQKARSERSLRQKAAMSNNVLTKILKILFTL